MKKLAIIGAGRVACSFAQNARDMNVETHCFAWEDGAMAKNVVDAFYPISIFEKERILEICRREGIDGVVATTELTIAIAAYIADALGKTGMPVDVANVITDKARNREAVSCIEELRQPRFMVVPAAEKLLDIPFPYPVIIKPLAKGGKRGITVALSQDDFIAGVRYAKSDGGAEEEILVEEFITGGMECSVETLSFAGEHTVVQVTEKVTSGPPHCVELAHHQPAPLSDAMRSKVEYVMKEALDAIGITNGPCHTELIIKDSDIYLVEFNARPGGDMISDPLVELSTGYPYIKGAIEIALGEFDGVRLNREKEKFAGICFLTEQTKHLMSVFDHCEDYEWLYAKHRVEEGCSTIIHNDSDSTNYFIYNAKDGRPV